MCSRESTLDSLRLDQKLARRTEPRVNYRRCKLRPSLRAPLVETPRQNKAVIPSDDGLSRRLRRFALEQASRQSYAGIPQTFAPMTGLLSSLFFLLASCTLLAGDASRQLRFNDEEAEVSDWEWLPITLDESERAILETRSDPPRTALDFYLLLPSSYFSRIENSAERRITFIHKESLTDQYLYAHFTIPQVDAGAFFVTIRVFQDEKDPLIMIRNRGARTIFRSTKQKQARLDYISVGYPQLWRFRDGNWIREDDGILPRITADAVIDRYRNHYKAHLKHPTQKKWISLGYALPREGSVIQVTGRENFMDFRETYVWQEYQFDGKRFVSATNSEQDGADQPATAPESKSEGKEKPKPESEGRPQ